MKQLTREEALELIGKLQGSMGTMPSPLEGPSTLGGPQGWSMSDLPPMGQKQPMVSPMMGEPPASTFQAPVSARPAPAPYLRMIDPSLPDIDDYGRLMREAEQGILAGSRPNAVPLVKPGNMRAQAPQAPQALPQAAQNPDAASGPTSRLFSDQEMRRSPLEAMQGSGAVSPDKPFMKRAELSEAQKKYEDRARRLDLFANLTESGQKFANTVRTSGEIMLGIQPGQYEATALRDAAARKREEISPAERDYYASMGIDVPEGMTRAQFKTGMPITLQQGQMPIEFARQQSADARAAERNAIGKERNAIAREASEENRKLREESAKRVGQTQAEEIANIDQNIAELEKIKVEKDKFNTGPYQEAFHWLGKYGTGQSPEYAGFRARVMAAYNSALKHMSGASVTASEAVRFKAAQPSMDDDDDVLKSKLDVMVDVLRGQRNAKLKGYASTGRDVSSFSPSQGASGDVQVVSPDGQIGDIPANEVDDFLKDNPEWRRQ